MKKIILSILLLSSFLDASFLLDKNTPVCIENFYYKKSRLYYELSSTGKWSSTTEDHQASNIHFGYEYDKQTKQCNPKEWLILGMDVKDFNFLMGLIGLLFGFVSMFFLIELFMRVGGKR